MARLLWLPQVLRDAGLKVAEDPGWQNRGGEMGDVVGVICHHTADPRGGNMPSLHTLIHGRPDLSGPLAQLGLGRDGTFYVIAAGKSNHAGGGEWRGITRGNTHFIGIEAENKGTQGDPYPEAQFRAYVHGVAAILRHVGRGSEFCVGHKEWARNRPPDRRKIDPLFGMDGFRASVAAVLSGAAAPLPLIPRVEPGGQQRPTLRRGMRDPLVTTVQRKLRITPVSEHFGPRTEAAVREFQRRHALLADGIIGPKTWQALDKL